jgi:hypothetical protein
LIVPVALIFIISAVRETAARNTAKRPPGVHEPPSASKYPGLLAYWSFDEGGGAEAADSSGNGQRARLINASWTGGIRGKAIHLNGPGSSLDYSTSPKLSFPAQAPFTLALWVRTSRGNGTLLSQRNSRDGGALMDIALRGGRLQAQVRHDGIEAFPATIDGAAVNDGAWHHVALTRDGDRIELFLDAFSQGQVRHPLAGGAITTDLRALGSERYWILKNARFGDPDFQGDIDEFSVFDRALKAEEVRSLAGR